MASMNGNDKGNTRSPETGICESLTAIRTEHEAAIGSTDASLILIDSKETARGYKICCLKRAEVSHHYYQDILTCITLENYKKTTISQANVEAYIKKDDEIEKLIKDSTKLLNELHTKIADANNAACTMANCVNGKIFPKSSKSKQDPDKVLLKGDMTEILNKTKMLDEKGQNAFESAVTIAGIQTFTNTASLKAFVTTLMSAMQAFKGCVESNISSTATEVTKIRGELNTAVEELAQVICDKNTFSTTAQGLESVIEFICTCTCDEGCIDICEEFGNCCSDDEQEEFSKKKKKHKHNEDQY